MREGIGMDVVLAVVGLFHRDVEDPKYRPAPMLGQMVAAGHVGGNAAAASIPMKDRTE
jgi:3-hydroxybutyryl-CoA dehydrogenase